MNKRKFFTILAMIVLPVALVLTFLSNSTDLFKGSILEDIIAGADFSVALTNPVLPKIADTDTVVTSDAPLYIDTSNTDPYFINYVTNGGTVEHSLQLYSTNEEFNLEAPGFDLDTAISELDPEQLLTGELSNVKIIKDSTGNILEIQSVPESIISDDNKVINVAWNKQCRYDRDLVRESESDLSFESTDFATCDNSLNHYLHLEVADGTDTRSFLFPVTFTNTQNVSWTLPDDSTPRFHQTLSNIASGNVSTAINKALIPVDFTTPDPASFSLNSPANYQYSVNLVSSTNNLFIEATELNEVDPVTRVLLPETAITSGTSTFEWDKQCNNAASEAIDCSDATALEFNMLQFNVKIDDVTKSYNFPIVKEFSDSLLTAEWGLPSQIRAISSTDFTRIIDGAAIDHLMLSHDDFPLNVQTGSHPFNFYIEDQYTYSADLIQTIDTPEQIAADLRSGTALENIIRLEADTTPRSGNTFVDWDGQCLDEDSDSESCNNNYMLFTIGNPNSTPVNYTYYLFPLEFDEADLSLYWLKNRPFTNSDFDEVDTDTFEATDTQPVNIEGTSNTEYYFSVNKSNATYNARIYYDTPGGEITLAQLAEDATTGAANIAEKFEWDKTCLSEDGSESSRERCLEVIDAGHEVKFTFDITSGDKDLIYISDFEFVRYLETAWSSPVNAKDFNFTSFPVNQAELGVNPSGLIYPSPIYVNLDPAEGTDPVFSFAVSGPFEATAKFIYSNNILAAYASANRGGSLQETSIVLGATPASGNFTWSRRCHSTLSCSSPEIAAMQKAIEVTITSTNPEVDTNNVYLFPLSFETPDRPTINIVSPANGSNQAANQDFIALEVTTNEAAICKANLEVADFDFDAASNIILEQNADKTVHTSETLDELPNNSAQTVHIKCAVETAPEIRNYARTDFTIARDSLDIEWTTPDLSDSDFTDTSDDAGKPYIALYNDSFALNPTSTSNLSLKFKPVNREVSYATFILSSDEEIDFQDILDDPESVATAEVVRQFINLAEVDGNTPSNYSRSNIDPGEETTIIWDKQCANAAGDKENCSEDNQNTLVVQIVDQDSDDINTYFFPITLSDEAEISSCNISGDELVFNPNTEGELFTYETTSENVTEFDLTIKILNSDDREITEVLDENNVDSASGSFAWEGEIGSSRTISDGHYTAVFNVEDNNSDASCEDSWNFLVDNSEPFTNAEFEILVDDDEFTIPDETLGITLNLNKDSYRTVVNVYKRGASKASATVYACVAGDDTSDEDVPCPDNVDFEWDGSHTFNYLPEGEYFLRGSMMDSSGITTASISDNFKIIHGNIRNSASSGACTDYFTDMSANDPLCPAVAFVREAEIFYGSSGRIEANRPLTRAEFITATNRIKEKVDPSVFRGTNPYSPQLNGDMGHPDLAEYVGNPKARWFMDEIWRAKQAGLVKGNADKTMRPFSLTNGPEAFKLVQLSTEINSSTESKNPWYSDYTEYNYRFGIDTGGITEQSTAVTRGQLIYYIYQLNRAGLYTP